LLSAHFAPLSPRRAHSPAGADDGVECGEDCAGGGGGAALRCAVVRTDPAAAGHLVWGFVVAQCGGPRHYADRIAALEVADAVSLTRTLRGPCSERAVIRGGRDQKGP
jgi:hypothetical protein